MQQVTSLDSVIDLPVIVTWRKETLKSTYVDTQHFGRLVRISEFRYEVQQAGDKVFGFSHNDFKRGVVLVFKQKGGAARTN